MEIQLIDNSNSEEFIRPIRDYLERKASEGPAEGGRPKTVFIHREGTAGFKARNLNLGLKTANGEFFLILDADSWVHADTLLSALPYFRVDPNLGFLQFRIDPLNEERNIISMSAAIMVRARYKVMALRDTQGLVQFDGHNGVFRREALESVGGWSEQVSEDLATSVKVVLAGYRARYANLPSGELVPSSLRELINQRKRWATGTMFFLRHDALSILKSSRLRWFEKLDLLFAALYIILEALICALVLTFAPLPIVSVLIILLVFSLLPTCLVTGAGPWRTIRRQASLIFIVSAILPALLQGAAAGMSNRELSFDVTRKFENVRMTVTDFMLGHGFGFAIALLFFSGAAWLCSGPVDFLNKYLAGTIIMGSVVAAPIMLELKSVRDRRAPDRSGS
jgi:cellulose synthase/poly-beta-1,6-N-acetylglucosamine synthase-like glycosyltransferase